MPAAEIVVAVGQAWLLAGLCVGVAFLVFGLDGTDAAARGAYGFRPLLLPGLVLLWPLVVWRWLDRPSPTREPSLARRQKRAHGVVWIGLACILTSILGTALALRRHDLPMPSSVRIDSTEAEEDE